MNTINPFALASTLNSMLRLAVEAKDWSDAEHIVEMATSLRNKFACPTLTWNGSRYVPDNKLPSPMERVATTRERREANERRLTEEN